MTTKLLNALLGAALIVTACGTSDPTSTEATQPARSNGTTLAGYKTIDICEVTPAAGTQPAVWKYSGIISVWNEGAIDTVGFKIEDKIEYMVGTKWATAFPVPVTYTGEIPAGTTQETALTFPYTLSGQAIAGTIRNNALLTILNHSSSLNTPFGPNPKATFMGTVQPCKTAGCTFSRDTGEVSRTWCGLHHTCARTSSS